MRARTVLALAVGCVSAAVALGQATQKATEAGHKAGASTPVFKAAADLHWADLDPAGNPGLKIADVWGDHTKGAFGAFVKAPAGWTTPLHTHSNAFKIIIISGTFLQTPEMKPEQRMGPGSYVMQPGGNYKHVSGCDKASECVFFTQSEGKFDLRPVGPPPAKK
jgi:quercetin dioxygenase-like cupin family protein